MTAIDDRRLAVVVVSYNSERWLAELLPYLTSQLPSSSVVVVDNASSDDSVRLATLEFECTVIRSVENVGFAAAANLGIQYLLQDGLADWLLVLNPDMRPTSSSAISLIRSQLATLGDRSVPLPLITVEGSIRPNVHPYLRPSVALRLALIGGPQKIAPRMSLDTHYLVGSFVLLHRELWLEVQGFDAGYFLYGEDADLSFRLAALSDTDLIRFDAHFEHFGNRPPWTLPVEQRRLLIANIKKFNSAAFGTVSGVASSLFLGMGAALRALGSTCLCKGDRAKAETMMAVSWFTPIVLLNRRLTPPSITNLD